MAGLKLLKAFVPKLCQLAQEMGEDEWACDLRSAALQALSSMIWFMGEYSHISTEIDNIVSVVLDNYEHKQNPENLDQKGPQNRWVQEVLKVEGHFTPSPDAISRIPSWKSIVNDKGEVNLAAEDAKSPGLWSRICVHNMAKLAREATTVRRVLESFFRYFDNGRLWSPEHGLALAVLLDMQLLMDKDGTASSQNTHLLLSILVKHLDHKNVVQEPDMQLDIVDVTSSLAQIAKIQPSVAILGAIGELMRHLRKCIHCSFENENLEVDTIKWNSKFQAATDECLMQLSKKVGDAGLVLEVMSNVLENISPITNVSKATVSAVYRAAQIVASIPNLSHHNKASYKLHAPFPESLFHQLLLAMVYPDHETRVGAHRIFSVVLVPSSVCPSTSFANQDPSKAYDLQRTLSRTVSVFSSSAALFAKLRKDKTSLREQVCQENIENPIPVDHGEHNSGGGLHKLLSSTFRRQSLKVSSVAPATDGETIPESAKELGPISLRLSSHQITLMLSSLWAQAISPENTPENYEAIAHTFSLVLLFSQAKGSNQEAIVRSFQFAFSLRNIAFREARDFGNICWMTEIPMNSIASLFSADQLQPSHRRSLFTLAMSLIMFSSKAYNVLPLIPCVKESLTDNVVDPFLHLIEDGRLQADASDHWMNVYGSNQDNAAALESLAALVTSKKSVESMASMIVQSMGDLSDVMLLWITESESSTLMQRLANDFLPDDVCPLGAPLLGDTQGQFGPVHEDTTILSEEDAFHEASQADPISQLSFHSPDLLTVNQLLDSVMETARQVGRFSVSTPDVTYKEMASHCEALLVGKEQKMAVFLTAQQKVGNPQSGTPLQHIEGKPISPLQVDYGFQMASNPFLDNWDVDLQKPTNIGPPLLCATEYQYQSQLRLPASSPYDNFLKAAGYGGRNPIKRMGQWSIRIYLRSAHNLKMARGYAIDFTILWFVLFVKASTHLQH
ncbi:hypothetical protein ACLOJK_016090 [Asimina triloba]